MMSQDFVCLVTVIIGHNTRANVPIIFDITNQITKIAFIFLVKALLDYLQWKTRITIDGVENSDKRGEVHVAVKICEWDQEQAMYHWALGDSSYSAISKLDIIEDFMSY
ncbi:hypothetical protein ACJX0J_033164, partial [Zea mays]